MEWNEYKEMSEKTLSTEFHVEKRDELLLHAVIGVLTEVEEILDNDGEDRTNLAEEVGDIFWYLAIIGREFNMDFPEGKEYSTLFKDKVGYTHNMTSNHIIIPIIKETCQLLDMMKKKLYYNKPIDDVKFQSITTSIMIHISTYCKMFGLDKKSICQTNIDKLRARYGDKFTSERAINRNLTKEREILEDGAK